LEDDTRLLRTLERVSGARMVHIGPSGVGSSRGLARVLEFELRAPLLRDRVPVVREELAGGVGICSDLIFTGLELGVFGDDLLGV
jgi:hypothetical protein